MISISILLSQVGNLFVVIIAIVSFVGAVRFTNTTLNKKM